MVHKGAGIRTIKASEFKARCLKLMDEVAQSGEEIVITKRGHPCRALCHAAESLNACSGPTETSSASVATSSGRLTSSGRRKSTPTAWPTRDSVGYPRPVVVRFGHARLGEEARHAIEHAWPAGEAGVSATSPLGNRPAAGKRRITLLQDVGAWRQQLLREGLQEVPVDGEPGIRAAELAGFHADPADRLIVATALNGHRLVTADGRILDWPGPLSRQRAED